jgi:crossover junction endodeoxyribonuclease RuvC
MPLVIGIDPGLAATGYGVLEYAPGSYRCRDYGVIRTSASDDAGRRLSDIYHAVLDVVQRFRPAIAGVESLYLTKNISSAIPVAQARGVVLLALAQQQIPTHEYTPQAIKQAVVGSGSAEKEQVIQMVRIILGLSEAPRPDHAADALAVAVTRVNTMGAVGVQ